MKENNNNNREDSGLGKSALRFISIIVIVAAIAGLVVTGLFVNDTLKHISGKGFHLSESEREMIEMIDLEELEDLRGSIQKKNSLDAPRAGRLRNPFAEYVPEEENAE